MANWAPIAVYPHSHILQIHPLREGKSFVYAFLTSLYVKKMPTDAKSYTSQIKSLERYVKVETGGEMVPPWESPIRMWKIEV